MIKNLALFLFLISLFELVKPQDKCTITDQTGRNIEGVCKEFSHCPAAISDYKSGIKPQNCKAGKRRRNTICCQTEQRISEKKCEEYSEKLQTTDGPMSFVGLDEDFKEIYCPALVDRVGFISGGRDALPVQFPHMVALGWRTRNGLKWNCGGTLISPKFVLTAAHCIDTKFGRPAVLLLGDIYLKNQVADPKAKKTRLMIKIHQIFKHPGFDGRRVYNDIALIELEKELELSREIFPACLPQPSLRLDQIKVVNATGWGILGYGDGQSDKLQEVNLQRISFKECNKYYDDDSRPDRPIKFPEGITRKMICAFDPNATETKKDTCNGDSGGPLTVNKEYVCLFHVIGITSFGSRYCGDGTPAVYTNVHSYLDWIENIVWPIEGNAK